MGACEVIDEPSRELLVAVLQRLQKRGEAWHRMGRLALEAGRKYFSHAAAQHVLFARIKKAALANDRISPFLRRRSSLTRLA